MLTSLHLSNDASIVRNIYLQRFLVYSCETSTECTPKSLYTMFHLPPSSTLINYVAKLYCLSLILFLVDQKSVAYRVVSVPGDGATFSTLCQAHARRTLCRGY